jgi:hypothetical protein
LIRRLIKRVGSSMAMRRHPKGLSRKLVRKIMIDNPRATYARVAE